MTFNPPRFHAWNKTNIALFMMTICVFIPLYAATSIAGHNNIDNTSNINAQSHNESETNQTISVPNNQPLDNLSLPLDESSSDSPFASEGVIEMGQLLIDPSYPIYPTHSPDGVQPLKPTKVVSSALLTAAPASPTAPNNLTSTSGFLHNQTSHESNRTRKMPLLSGSMTIALPNGTPPVPTAAPTPINGSIPPSSLSPNNSVVLQTPDTNMSSTPTTSTMFVYATNPPAPSSPASNAMNSASCRVTLTSSYRSIGLGSLVYLIVRVYL